VADVVERLEAAIERLEQLRAESHDWRVPVSADEDGPQVIHDFDTDGHGPGTGPLAWTTSDEAAANIVLLHRTIDAQLAILNHASARAVSKIQTGGVPRAVWSHEKDALVLADAILSGGPLLPSERDRVAVFGLDKPEEGN
jgi:hypothetical protein